MSFWGLVYDTCRSLAQRGKIKPGTLKKLKSVDRQVAFAVALIALGAKMAKADGQVTVGEIRAFKKVFRFRNEDQKKVAMVFNLAKQTVAGYEQYAASVAKLYKHDKGVRDDVMEGLFQIAAADGNIGSVELEFLGRVNEIFDLSERSFSQRRYRFSIIDNGNPYKILGVHPSDDYETIHARWKELVRQSHPDILMARGTPPEAARLAQARVADYNRSWDEIRKMLESTAH